MKIQKESFYLASTLILIAAAILAFFFRDLTDDFIIPTTLHFLNLPGPQSDYIDFFSPDVSFFCFFSIVFFVTLRFCHDPEVLTFIIYGASAFFCFFFFFISPLEALLVMPAFIAPVFIWHRNRIGNIALALIALGLVLLSWYLLKKPALFLLMMPMCHLFAIRANNAMKSRYSRGEVRVLAKLSQTQQQKVIRSHSIFDFDLWDIIGPEIEALGESWSKVQKLSAGNAVADEDDDLMPRTRNFGILSSLLEIQDHNDLNAALKQLQKRDPAFSSEKFLEKFRTAFNKIHDACYEQKIESVQAMISDALFEQFRCRIEEQQEAGVRFKCNEIRLEQIRLARVSSDELFDELHILVAGELVETAIDLVTGEALNAQDKVQKICEYWSFIRRPSAKTLDKPGLIEGNCPNCGAPISIGQATVCPVCSSFIRSGHYDWVLSQITQACEWEYANSMLIPGWNDLKKADPEFSVQQIEDRCAVVFWMVRLAERKRLLNPVKRFSTAKFCESFEFFLKSSARFTIFENISFASATLKAIVVQAEVQKIYLLVVWSGIPAVITPEGRLPQLHRFSKPRQDVFVFVRNAGQKTNNRNTLSSAHCRACGGPLTSDFAINCNYCNALLNDGSEWLLEKILNSESQEYVAVQLQKQKLIREVVVAVKQERSDQETIRSGRELITIATQMLLADGKIDEAEMRLLKTFATRYAVPDELFNGIVEAVKQEEIRLPTPKNLKEAHALMEAAIMMALADGEIAEEEQKFIDELAAKFGYGKTDLNMLMRKVTMRLKQEKTAEKLLKK